MIDVRIGTAIALAMSWYCRPCLAAPSGKEASTATLQLGVGGGYLSGHRSQTCFEGCEGAETTLQGPGASFEMAVGARAGPAVSVGGGYVGYWLPALRLHATRTQPEPPVDNYPAELTLHILGFWLDIRPGSGGFHGDLILGAVLVHYAQKPFMSAHSYGGFLRFPDAALGGMAGAGYDFPIGDALRVGPELGLTLAGISHTDPGGESDSATFEVVSLSGVVTWL